MAEPDLSKVIELIMSHPEIISEINGILKKETNPDEPPSVEDVKAENSSEETSSESTDVTEKEAEATSAYIAPSSKNIERERRGELLRALKPYVSTERGKAIESMLTIADILDVMRNK